MNKKLIKAVIDNLNYDTEEELLETFQDVCNHGANNGFGNFIYHSDTIAFFKKNKREIIDLLNEYADDFGQDVISLVAGFNCLKDYCNDREGKDEIGRAIYGRLASDDVLIPNALAWFALEEVARFVVDGRR